MNLMIAVSISTKVHKRYLWRCYIHDSQSSAIEGRVTRIFGRIVWMPCSQPPHIVGPSSKFNSNPPVRTRGSKKEENSYVKRVLNEKFLFCVKGMTRSNADTKSLDPGILYNILTFTYPYVCIPSLVFGIFQISVKTRACSTPPMQCYRM